MNTLDQIVTELLEDRGVYFDAENVYNFYVIAYTHQTIKDLSPSTKSQLEFLLDEVKNNILVVYKNLIIRQIQKYIERNRTTQPITLDQESNETLETLLQKMKRTVRADLKRPNERWEALLTAMISLENAHATDVVIAAIDKIFNMVHNTKTNILGKFAGADELLKALDACAETPRVEAILPKCSHDVKEMFEAAGRNESAKSVVKSLLGEAGEHTNWQDSFSTLAELKEVMWATAWNPPQRITIGGVAYILVSTSEKLAVDYANPNVSAYVTYTAAPDKQIDLDFEAMDISVKDWEVDWSEYYPELQQKLPRGESPTPEQFESVSEGAGMPWKQKQGMLYRGMKKIQWKLAKGGIESRYTQLRLHGAGFDIIYHTAQVSSGDFAAWPVVTIDSGPQAGQYHNIYSVKSKGSLDDGLKAIMALHQLPTTEAPTAADFM